MSDLELTSSTMDKDNSSTNNHSSTSKKKTGQLSGDTDVNTGADNIEHHVGVVQLYLFGGHHSANDIPSNVLSSWSKICQQIQQHEHHHDDIKKSYATTVKDEGQSHDTPFNISPPKRFARQQSTIFDHLDESQCNDCGDQRNNVSNQYDTLMHTWRGARPKIENLHFLTPRNNAETLRHRTRIPILTAHGTGAAIEETRKASKEEYKHMKVHQKLLYIFRRFRQYVCQPTSTAHRVWASIIVLSVIWFSFVTPVQMAFYRELDYPSIAWLKWTDFSLDMLFVLDILKSLVTGYNKDETVVFNFKSNLKRYATDGTLFFDLLSITYIPFLFYPVNEFSAGWSLTRLARIYKVPLYVRHISKGNIASKRYAVLRLLKYFIGVIISIHGFACLYLFTAAIEIFNGQACTWLSTPSSSCASTGLINASEYTRYVAALLWSTGSMASDGYGPATPQTEAEQILTTIWFLAGQLYFVYLVAMLTSILALNDTAYAQFQSKLRSVGAYMHYKRIPSELQERAVEFYLYAWQQRQTYPFLDHDLLDDLSASIRRDIIAYVIKPLLDQVEIFKECDLHFLRKLMYRMRPLILVPGDLLTLERDVANSMFFISKGSVEVTREGDPICILSENEHFGELSLFLPIRRNVTARALTHCDVYRLTQEDLKEVLSDYPEEYHKILHRVHEQIQSPNAHQHII